MKDTDRFADETATQKRFDLASAKQDVATPLAHVAAAGWSLDVFFGFHQHWWGWALTAAAYFLVYFLLKRPFDKDYDQALAAITRLRTTGL